VTTEAIFIHLRQAKKKELKRTSNYVFKKNLTTTLTYEESEKS
jgi:hypothetical protein